jgi:hypothetical protein
MNQAELDTLVHSVSFSDSSSALACLRSYFILMEHYSVIKIDEVVMGRPSFKELNG